jgi:hypothetical protein
MEVGIHVPQVVLSFEDMRHRAERCEQLGIRSLRLYDHLHGPGMPTLPSLEAWTLATALLASTRTLRVGHLDLCSQFRTRRSSPRWPPRSTSCPAAASTSASAAGSTCPTWPATRTSRSTLH